MSSDSIDFCFEFCLLKKMNNINQILAHFLSVLRISELKVFAIDFLVHCLI